MLPGFDKYLHPVPISPFVIPNNLWLAPLAGYSNKPFRLFASRFGAGYAVTEMVSLEGLVRGDRNTWRYIDTQDEPFTTIQLFGKSDPAKYYKASRMLQDKIGVQVIDVNFGCPVKKVIRTGAGSSLLREPSSMGDIVKALKDSGVAVSSKIRIGFDSENIEQTVPVLDKAGSDIIIVHGRLATQFYSGKADWSVIARAREMTSAVFIANGDITTPEDAKAILDQTKADGIMIGRQAVGSPYLFKQIIDYFTLGTYSTYSLEEIKGFMLEFALLFVNLSKKDHIVPVRSALIQYVKNYKNSREIRHQLSSILTLTELETILKTWN